MNEKKRKGRKIHQKMKCIIWLLQPRFQSWILVSMVQWIKQYSVRVDENVVVLYSPQLDIHKNRNQNIDGNNLGRNGFSTKTKLVEKL